LGDEVTKVTRNGAASSPASLATLLTGAAELRLSLTDSQAAALLRLLDELDDWNQRMNLTAIRERAQQITKHLLDSLAVHAHLHGSSVVDIGTGAGFPGLPLAIALPQSQFVLVDSTGKKLKFVEHAVQVLGLHNVQTAHTRAETYRPKERFDCVVSRAIGPLETFVKWSGHLCVGGGRLLAMKGRYPTDELAHIPGGWKLAAVHRLNIPGLDEQRHLVELCRSHDKV
jgi:16S rRNA (guanine527-N7)-methyltransferase